MEEDCFYKNGLHFKCTQCSLCCRIDPGHVYLNENEIILITQFLDISKSNFLEQYCRTVHAFNSIKYSLIEKSNFDCIFWDAKLGGCQIYEVRPVQCKTFPFWPSLLKSKEIWNSYAESCPGINKGKNHSYSEILKQKKLYEKAIYGSK